MNDQLQSKLVEILGAVQSATKAAGDFALDQLPDIAQSYVAYGRAMSTLAVVFGITVLVVLALNVRRAFEKFEELAVITMIFPAALSTFVVLANIGPMLLVWFAPKVWLLREIAGLLGGK